MKGVTVHTRGRTCHLRIHYTADPERDPATKEGKKWFEHAMEGLPELERRREYELDYTSRGGEVVFPRFSVERHVGVFEPIPDNETTLAWDFGVVGSAATLAQVTPGKDLLILFESVAEREQTSSFVERTLEMIKDKWPRLYVYHLAEQAAKSQQTIENDRGKSDLEILESFGVKATVRKYAADEGIVTIEELLCPSGDVTARPRLFVNKSCGHAIEAFSEYHYPAEKKEPMSDRRLPVKDEHSHIMDTIRWHTVRSFALGPKKQNQYTPKVFRAAY